MKQCDGMPWSWFFECWVLSQVFHFPLSPSSRCSLVSCFLPLGCYLLHILSCWYFSQQSWFQLVIHTAWHLAWCTLGSDGKAFACNAGDPGLIPALGRSPGEGNGNPLQYSCLENSMDWGAWWATVHGVAKSRTRLSNFTSRDMSVWVNKHHKCGEIIYLVK